MSIGERRALRHLAHMVASGSSPSVIFEAVAGTLGRLIEADHVTINRCEIDQTMSIVTVWSAPGVPGIGLPFGGRWIAGTDTPSAAVLRTHRPARQTTETMEVEVRGWHEEHRIGHAVACPVVVNDRPWGTMGALYRDPEPPPDDVEDRMGEFADFLNCVMTQAETHAELIALRSRLITTADATRRRFERDLHDGVQQHLVTLALQLGDAEARVPPEHQELKRRLSGTVQGLSDVLIELQEISRGLRPPILARRGLEAALAELVSRSPVRVELDMAVDRRLSEELEVTLYRVASEALTNVLKHAHASLTRVRLHRDGSRIHLAICDDGVGGADTTRGSGLTGLKDRVNALGGTVQITSPAGNGTSVLMTIPCM
ncbi:GAF domain-containing sensor histidine kinase [Actinomadura sp. DC4]|uniref:GAF domain-containing sensor histidine kinase n=1 Tax=Actinomadura sp. DC4 TaxID=3055069 RepID=UPI0025B1288D|nr:GAF domain-containing sensor histidine kinase [Actinomadura sp. DC4]MDN3358563.1 GAF domain-containing sensor histidine kinase [Actinomadura sp. DC4]